MFGDLYQDGSGQYMPAQQRLQELISEIKLADEIGLDAFGIGEHHRKDYAVPSPEIILAAASTVTRNIKLGSAVTVLSSSDPVKVYQNFAMIDLLSNGRAELMVGRGSFTESFPLFGYRLSDYNALFEEKLDLLLTINEKELITWTGKLRPSLTDQYVLPRAVDNRLKIWIAAGGTPESVARAGRLGLPLVIAVIGGYPRQFTPLFRLYKEEYQRHGHSIENYATGLHAHLFVGEDSRKVADFYYPYYAKQMDKIGRDRGWPPYQRHQFDGGRSKDGALFVGEPAEIVDKILMQAELFGLTRFMGHVDVGGPPHKELMKSIELFGTKVAPEVRKALGLPRFGMAEK